MVFKFEILFKLPSIKNQSFSFIDLKLQQTDISFTGVEFYIFQLQ